MSDASSGRIGAWVGALAAALGVATGVGSILVYQGSSARQLEINAEAIRELTTTGSAPVKLLQAQMEDLERRFERVERDVADQAAIDARSEGRVSALTIRLDNVAISEQRVIDHTLELLTKVAEVQARIEAIVAEQKQLDAHFTSAQHGKPR
jgi:hypothetical protein